MAKPTAEYREAMRKQMEDTRSRLMQLDDETASLRQIIKGYEMLLESLGSVAETEQH